MKINFINVILMRNILSSLNVLIYLHNVRDYMV